MTTANVNAKLSGTSATNQGLWSSRDARARAAASTVDEGLA
jgi:hypothetical protein